MSNGTEIDKGTVDVIVIGGGAAGLNGALMLARSRRSVVVVDSGSPRNAPAHGVHGFLTRDGIPPSELLRIGRDEVCGYGVRVIDGEVVDAVRDQDGFLVTLADGTSLLSRRLLVTTGLVDRLPAIEGLAERWGQDVIHCPYCHGWEARDRAIGVIATGPMSMHGALLFRQLSDDVVYFGNDTTLDDAQHDQLAALGIEVVDGAVASVIVADDTLSGVRTVDGRVIPRQVVVVASRMEAQAGFLAGLGLVPVDHPGGVGEHIPSDEVGRTEVPGVWVAGNVTDLSAQVGPSAAAGAMAGAHINADLVAEDAQTALERYRTDDPR